MQRTRPKGRFLAIVGTDRFVAFAYIVGFALIPSVVFIRRVPALMITTSVYFAFG